ncbi:MAG: hypothetical protein ACKJRM_09840 [Porticoccaceae bacterium]|nr:hypothetical protein [Porticoccaceae bacterium]CAI8304636.1 MAG: Uncharacterised protein [Porticoccaceae bacterium UBA1117]
MFRTSAVFLISVLIAMSCVALQTSVSNLLWLNSINMPVTVSVIVSMLMSDLVGMSAAGAYPIIVVVFAGLLIAFIVAFLLSKWINTGRRVLYALAGGTALFAIVVLMPLAFYNLDLIAGARTLWGKLCLILGGAIAGYYFGAQLSGGHDNEEA